MVPNRELSPGIFFHKCLFSIFHVFLILKDDFRGNVGFYF